jgi:hypothetical protein
MPFQLPQTTVVETRKLRQLLKAIEEEQFAKAEALAKNILGLDKVHHPAED